jgi:hypothetical protein
MDEEPSVLDYVKALLTPWKGKPPKIPADTPEEETPSALIEFSADSSELDNQPVQADAAAEQPVGVAPLSNPQLGDAHSFAEAEAEEIRSPEKPERPGILTPNRFPWLMILGFVLALIAQSNLEPPDRKVTLAIGLYGAAAVCLVVGLFLKEWTPVDAENSDAPEFSKAYYPLPFWISLPILLIAFYLFRGNTFTGLNLSLWIGGLALFIGSLIEYRRPLGETGQRILRFFRRQSWTLRVSRWTIMLVIAFAAAIFFRFYRLDGVLAEMFSDHAEKLLDVSDVLSGKFSIFFPRNTGREAIQMYLTALVAIVCGTKISYMSLKIGTALAGLLTLPFIYLLGKQIGNRWVGLFSFVLAAFAYWPNVISRVGLRFPLTPLFVAPVMFFVVRGLMERRRNDFIWAGLFLGLGLHGYSPTRFLPVVVVAAIILYVLHRQSLGNRKGAVTGLILVAAVSLVIFLPLLMYMLQNFNEFWQRALSRSGTIEAAYPGPVILIFLNNLWRSMIMFFYDNGNIWVHSIPGRPALDVITAALYFCGLILLLIRYIRRRNWLDLFLLVSIPLLMMPSILSLAFPDENPSLNRSGGALVPVFIVAGLGLEALIGAMRKSLPGKMKAVPALAAVVLIGFSGAANFDLVFTQFDQQFRAGAWNTSQIGAVIQNFAGAEGSYETAYVIPYPYWVDTRLVGINAGDPLKDYALWREDLPATLSETRAKLFILNVEDTESAQDLESLYPDGHMYLYDSGMDGKDFLTYYVPPAD